MDTRHWTAPQWQAWLQKVEPFAKRRWILENLVPEQYRARVKNHLMTVRAIRRFNERKKRERNRRN